MRVLIAVLAACLFAQNADAQIFPRAPWNKYQQAQVSSSCPGGICPTNASSVLSAPQQRGHWSYPGTIESHLESTHGVATAGMTRQQKLNLHDSLHEGTVTASAYRSSAYGAPVIVRSTPAVVSYGSFGSVSHNYGSAGSVVQSQYVPAQLSVINTTPVVQARALVQSTPQEVRLGLDGFRASLSRAVTEARKDGTLKPREALRLQVRMLSPAFIEQAHDLAVTQIAFSGETNEAVPLDAEGKVNVAGINWDGLIAFLEKLLPLLLKLFSAFGL